MSTEEMALLCFTIICSLLMVALTLCLILECYKEKNTKRIKEYQNEIENLNSHIFDLEYWISVLIDENKFYRKKYITKRK